MLNNKDCRINMSRSYCVSFVIVMICKDEYNNNIIIAGMVLL